MTTTSLAFLVFSLLLGHTIASMAMLVVPAVAPAVAAEYNVDPSMIGYLISFVGAGFFLSLLFFGNLGHCLGACRVYQMGHLTIACGMLVMMVPSMPVLVAGSFVIGMGHGLLAPSASTLLMRFSPPERRNLIFSIQQTGVPFGGMLAALTAPAIAVNFGWRWALLVNAVTLFSIALMIQPKRAAWDAERDPLAPVWPARPFDNVVSMWRDPRVRPLALMGGCFSWGQFVVASYTVVAAVSGLGMSLIVAGTVLTVVQVGNATGRVIAGWLADRVGAVRVLGWTAWASLATALISILMDPQWPGWAIYLLFAAHGMTTGAWAGLVLAAAARAAAPDKVGGAVSGVMMFVSAGKLIGPVIFALAYGAAHHYGIAFASLALPAAIAIYAATRMQPRSTATDTAAAAASAR